MLCLGPARLRQAASPLAGFIWISTGHLPAVLSGCQPGQHCPPGSVCLVPQVEHHVLGTDSAGVEIVLSPGFLPWESREDSSLWALLGPARERVVGLFQTVALRPFPKGKGIKGEALMQRMIFCSEDSRAGSHVASAKALGWE